MADNPWETWVDMMRSLTPPSIAAPSSLTQTIAPMSLLTVNTTNSASPGTEAAVVAAASYGRQIGRLIDAVEALIAERDMAAKTPDEAAKAAEKAKKAFAGLADIAEIVAKAKLAAAVARLDGIKADLDEVRNGAPAVFAAHRASLREALDREPGAKAS